MALLTWNYSQDNQSKFRPAVILTHNFGGTQDNFTKHISLLNNIGFDVVSFDLNWHKNGDRKVFTNFLMPYWANEIEQVFQEVLSQRDVISFAFSGLSFCVINKLPKLIQKNPSKIKALIFDSGPFENYVQCIRNMVRDHFGLNHFIARESLTYFLTFTWGPHSTQKIHQNIKKISELSRDLPVLSLQGAKDTIVPQEYIHACLSNPSPPHLTEVVFEKGGHLTSLKEEPEKYKEVLLNFLSGFLR